MLSCTKPSLQGKCGRLISDSFLNFPYTLSGSELSDKFWDHLKGAHQCLRDYRRYNDPTKPDRRVKIAILDSGADLSHPKIRHQIDEIEEYNPEPVVLHSFVDLDGSPDPLGHGTHITSTILSIASGAKLFVGRVVGKDKKVDPEALAEVLIIQSQSVLRSNPLRL